MRRHKELNDEFALARGDLIALTREFTNHLSATGCSQERASFEFYFGKDFHTIRWHEKNLAFHNHLFTSIYNKLTAHNPTHEKFAQYHRIFMTQWLIYYCLYDALKAQIKTIRSDRYRTARISLFVMPENEAPTHFLSIFTPDAQLGLDEKQMDLLNLAATKMAVTVKIYSPHREFVGNDAVDITKILPQLNQIPLDKILGLINEWFSDENNRRQFEDFVTVATDQCHLMPIFS